MTEKSLTDFLTTKIPVTKLMGIQVLSLTPQAIKIKAPLSIHHNHMGTAFGGSLSTFMILSCYSWLFTLLSEKTSQFHIVIKDSETKYLVPLNEDIVATCLRPDEEEIQKFLLAYEKKGVARITLSSFIDNSGGETCCTLTGTFVARK